MPSRARCPEASVVAPLPKGPGTGGGGAGVSSAGGGARGAQCQRAPGPGRPREEVVRGGMRPPESGQRLRCVTGHEPVCLEIQGLGRTVYCSACSESLDLLQKYAKMTFGDT